MGLLSKSHKNMAESTAAKAAPNATAAAVPVLILWASEKFTQGRQSGAPISRAMDVIAEVESTGAMTRW